MRKFGQGAIIFIYTRTGEQGLGAPFFAFMKTKRLKDKTVSQAFSKTCDVVLKKQATQLF